MDLFLEKDIATLTVLYANLQLERIDQYKTTMQKKKKKETLEAPMFEEDCNYKDYAK
jgi:hypothetical protein